MKMSMTLTMKVQGSPAAEAARVAAAEGLGEDACLDMYDVAEIVADLQRNADKAESALVAVAKKAGLKVVERGGGRAELAFGAHGSKRHPAEHWYQIRAAGA